MKTTMTVDDAVAHKVLSVLKYRADRADGVAASSEARGNSTATVAQRRREASAAYADYMAFNDAFRAGVRA